VAVIAQTSGSLTAVYAGEGELVKATMLLAQIDDRDLKLRRENLELARQISELKYQDLKNGNSKALIRQAIANRDQIKAQLSGSQKEIDYLQDQIVDMKNLVENGASTQQQETELQRALDKELAKNQTLKEQLKSAQEGLNITLEGAVTEQLKQALLDIQIKSNEIAQMDLSIEKAKALAPHEGIVQNANFKVGEVVVSGQKLFSIIDPTTLKLKVFVNERNLSLIKRDMLVTVTGDFVSDKPLVGEVEYIATEAEFTPKNIESKESKQEMVYEVHISIVDPSGAIKPGMYLDADFGVNANEK
jgi:HlyD family secretion protein